MSLHSPSLAFCKFVLNNVSRSPPILCTLDTWSSWTSTKWLKSLTFIVFTSSMSLIARKGLPKKYQPKTFSSLAFYKKKYLKYIIKR